MQFINLIFLLLAVRSAIVAQTVEANSNASKKVIAVVRSCLHVAIQFIDIWSGMCERCLQIVELGDATTSAGNVGSATVKILKSSKVSRVL